MIEKPSEKDSVYFESPTQFDGIEFIKNERLPVIGGPYDGSVLSVPVIFDSIVPHFAKIGMHFYQLHGFAHQWRFSFTASRAW